MADIAVWPLSFASAENDLGALYATMEENAKQITEFLREAGFSESEITGPGGDRRVCAALRIPAPGEPSLHGAADRDGLHGSRRRGEGSAEPPGELGKKGIALGGEGSNQSAKFLFTKLNELKPIMIEEATRNARAVAEKFAADSKSTLGKIRRASQGQFSIEDRDSNTPHTKGVRVVSTVEYYLSD